ncbi:MAG: tetratricopeptide repeat protein [Oscillospiraceae bacterium]|nr:tetratricopeptide repeat protein [Oscillospiraceae bacterium]
MTILSISLGVCLFVSGRHLVNSIQLSRIAKTYIGEDVSIYSDIGARFAYKGICAYMNDDYSPALRYLEKALEHSIIHQNSAFCLDWLAKCYSALGKESEALDCLVKAVNSEPANLRALFSLADTYIQQGAFSKAEFYYSRVLQYDSDNLAANFMLGMIRMGRGEYNEAEEQFFTTIGKDEKFLEALEEMSVVMAIKGDYAKMDSYFAQASKRRPNKSDRLEKKLNAIKRMRSLCNDL